MKAREEKDKDRLSWYKRTKAKWFPWTLEEEEPPMDEKPYVQEQDQTESVRKSFDEPLTKSINFNLSGSVDRMMKVLGNEQEVYPYQPVEYLLDGHLDYAKSFGRRPVLDKERLSEGEKKLVAKWIDEVWSLYNHDKVNELHGKLVILGLALLDQNLGRQLAKDRFIYALKDDLREKNFESLLNEKGKELWDRFFVEHDTVRTLTDNPAAETEVDILGRQVFASGLVERMVQIRQEEKMHENRGAFLIHIHGPWGSGKTSVLNFMRYELEKETDREGKKKEKWIVVSFNAWQHQRTAPPPWWSIMDAVFKRALGRPWNMTWWRYIVIFLWEYLWRLWKGRSPIFWGLTIVLILIGLGIWFNVIPINSLTSSDNNTISASLAFIVSLLTGLQAISTSLVPGSARAAEEFEKMNGDPMEQISKHFEKLVNMIKQPIAIFVDDLDRCNDSYTVEFLERIQTLFRQAGVFYIVAADRRWLFSSYEKVYNSFKNDVQEPGRPLGYLFLAKTFQLSVALPQLSPELQKRYWEYLLQTEQYNIKERHDAARKEVEGEFKDLSDEAILNKTEEKTGDVVKDQVRKEVAVIELAKKERKRYTEQFLKPYATFLEPNPRAMKRLVNAYSLARDILILEGSKIERQKLALWTIITMRWPLLAQYLEEDPSRVKHIIPEGKFDNPNIANIGDDIKKLFSDKDIISVIKGEKVGGPLDEYAIRTLIAHEPTGSAS